MKKGFWSQLISEELRKPYMDELMEFLKQEIKEKNKIYPPSDDFFKALDLTPFEKVRVIILGQDPYHGEGQANGLAFSVNMGAKIPPSLKNIYTEITKSLDVKMPHHGDLTSWANQGVLLLNTCLTVSEGSPSSHRGRGWETFTDRVIMECNAKDDRKLIFALWGAQAQLKQHLIDSNRHMILKAPHPSPYSAYTGFMGCNHFLEINYYLRAMGESPIKWGLDG